MPQQPYLERRAGEPVSAADWNLVQELIREEVRQHAHGGGAAGEADPRQLGTPLDAAGLAAAAVQEAGFADGAVGDRELAPASVRDGFVSADAAIPEERVAFAPVTGHDHDGRNSRRLGAESIGSVQLGDGSVTLRKLTPVLRGELRELEELLGVPQVLSVRPPAAPGGTRVTLVGHGFGRGSGTVALLVPSGGSFLPASQGPQVISWSDTRIVVRLPAEPTGLLQVIANRVPLNPIAFNESLAVTRFEPDPGTLDAPVDATIRVHFSTELLAFPRERLTDSPNGLALWVRTPATPTGAEPLVPLPAEPDPQADLAVPLLPHLPVEVIDPDGVPLPGVLRLAADRRSVSFLVAPAEPTAGEAPGDPLLPHHTELRIRVHGADTPAAQGKPLLLSSGEAPAPLPETREARFRTRLPPPASPLRVSVGSDSLNRINRANVGAVSIWVDLPPSVTSSDWVRISLSDGARTIEEQVPAGGGGRRALIILDARSLEDGPLALWARTRNLSSESPAVAPRALDPRSGEEVAWILKDTRDPYLRVHPVRSPTSHAVQPLDVEVEPGSTVVVTGGARAVTQRDADHRGRLRIPVDLTPNAGNVLRVQATDPAGNRSGVVSRDHAGDALLIRHDDTIPELRLDPIRSPTQARELRLHGRVSESALVIAAGMDQVVSVPSGPDRSFDLRFPLRANAANDLRVVATDPAGNTSVPLQLRVVHDDRPPPLKLRGKAYYQALTGAATPTPTIVLENHTRASVGGSTEPGATVTLSGHGHRVEARADAQGVFDIAFPFRFEPVNKHDRRALRSWTFQLDAVDLSGNRTHQAKRLQVLLRYRLPDDFYQYWHYGWGWTWYWGGFRPIRWIVDERWHYWDAFRGRAVDYYQRGRRIVFNDWFHSI